MGDDFLKNLFFACNTKIDSANICGMRKKISIPQNFFTQETNITDYNLEQLNLAKMPQDYNLTCDLILSL